MVLVATRFRLGPDIRIGVVGLGELRDLSICGFDAVRIGFEFVALRVRSDEDVVLRTGFGEALRVPGFRLLSVRWVDDEGCVRLNLVIRDASPVAVASEDSEFSSEAMFAGVVS